MYKMMDIVSSQGRGRPELHTCERQLPALEVSLLGSSPRARAYGVLGW